MEKKGLLSLGQLTGIVLVLVLIGVMLTVGLKIESDIQSDMDTESVTVTLTNSSTLTVVNDTGTAYPLGVDNFAGIRNCALSITQACNATVGTVNSTDDCIAVGNYTISGCYLDFVGTVTDKAYNNTLWNITGSYTHTVDTIQWNATGSAMEGLTNVAENQGLLGTIIIFGVIISVVVVAFAVRGGM